jgi:Na+-transporting NADH:ubiquinone oxidoreductase subunit B
MKPLRRILERMKPAFSKGGKLEKLYPLYEGADTFLFTPGEVTRNASHIRDGMDLKRMMITVVVALVPCIYMAMWNTGYQANLTLSGDQDLLDAASKCWRGAILNYAGLGCDPTCWLSNVLHGALYFVPVFLVCNIVGGAWEVLFACVRKHEINEGFLVTGMLFPLTLPPTIPLWQVALGVSFGVVLGKEVFGGTGKNFLNPALTARAFLYFAYPVQMTGDRIWTAVDGFTAATPLGALAAVDMNTGMAAVTAPVQDGGISISWAQAFLGQFQGSMGETSTLACLIGALILIGTGVGSWRIMAGVLIGAMGLSGLFYWLGTGPAADSITNAMFLMPPQWHLVVGGLAFGLVFMATDPVSAAMTETGKWFYGALIGVMTILIRVVNPAFPEGIMLAILFGNVFAPLIDHVVVQANIKRRQARNAA